MSSLAIVGHSLKGLPIFSHFWEGKNSKNILILSGVHGNEPESQVAVFAILESFIKDYPLQASCLLIPTLNIDGTLLGTRGNARGVDLNRNLATADWRASVSPQGLSSGSEPLSEPENKALLDCLISYRPSLIISLHSWRPLLNVNGQCLSLAKAISAHTGAPICADIGYPTAASLGSYALEKGIPLLTYELARDAKTKEIIEKDVPALIAALKGDEHGY